MYAVTYEAEELNLLPAHPHSTLHFFGEIDLNGSPLGDWTIGAIRVSTTDYSVRPIVQGTVSLPAYHPLYPIVVAALREHDAKTGAVSDHVREQLEFAHSWAAADYGYQLGKDMARGLEERS